MLIDSHCHIDSPVFTEELPSILEAMDANQVKAALTVCCSIREYERALDFSRGHQNIWCSVGVHPSTDDDHEATAEELVELSGPENVVAIGECGLDYHYNDKSTWDNQKKRFETHIAAAKQANLPVIVHSRSANEDAIDILRCSNAQDCGFVLHCFCGDMKMARDALDMGGYISFSGIVTFKNSQEIQEVARWAPLDRILVETDCPYLSPVPFRGKQNDPSRVLYVAQKVAELREMPLEAVAGATTNNFFKLFSKATTTYYDF